MKAAHVTCLLVLLGSVRLHAADPTTDYTWDSPDKRFRAISSTGGDLPRTRIVSLAKPGEPPLYDQFLGRPMPGAIDPPFIGLWSNDGTRFAIFFVEQGDHGGLRPLAYPYRYWSPEAGREYFEMGGSPKVCNLESLQPEIMDRLASLHGDLSQWNFGSLKVNACRWKGTEFIEADNELEFGAQGKIPPAKLSGRAKWTVTTKLTLEGFAYADTGPISYTLLDSAGKEGPWQTLPVTDQDRLRIAVRLNRPDLVSALLAKGGDPNKDPIFNLATLAAQVNGAPELALLLKARVDINRNLTGRPSCLSSAITADDPAVLSEVLSTKPDPANFSSFDAWQQLLAFLPQNEGDAVVLENFDVIHAEMSFLRKLPMLTGAKYDINSIYPKTGRTPLILAVDAQVSPKVIKAMLAAGADPDVKDGTGKTAIDRAADSRQIPVLRLLDKRQLYAGLVQSYDIPAGSPYVDTWSLGDGLVIAFSQDGTGAVNFPGSSAVYWRVSGDHAELEIHLTHDNRPTDILKGIARLSADKSTLTLIVDHLTVPQGVTLTRDKSE